MPNQTPDESTPYVPQMGDTRPADDDDAAWATRFLALPGWLTSACRAAFPSDQWQVRGPFGPTEFSQQAYDLPLDEDEGDGVFVEPAGDDRARVFLALSVSSAELPHLLAAMRALVIKHAVMPHVDHDAGYLRTKADAEAGVCGRLAMVEGSPRACDLPETHVGVHVASDGFAWHEVDEDDEDGALPRTGCASEGGDAHVADSPAELGEYLLAPTPPLSAMPAWDEDAWVRVTFTPGAYRWKGATSHIGGMSVPVIYHASELTIRAPGDDKFRPVKMWTFIGAWVDGAVHEWVCDIDDELESIAPKTEVDGVVEIIPRTDVVRTGSPHHASRRQHV